MSDSSLNPTPPPFEFQAFSWTVDDGVSDSEDYDNMDFTVHVFGKTRTGESAAIHVSGFAPSFCVRFPEEVSDLGYYDSLQDLLRLQLKLWDFSGDSPEEIADLGDHLIDLPDNDKVLHKKTLWGFENSKQHPFFKYAFKSQQAYNKLKGLFKACGKHTLTSDDLEMFYDEVKAVREENKGKGNYEKKREEVNSLVEVVALDKQISERVLRWVIKLGDANLPLDFARAKLFEVIDPILRFAHLRDLRMAGWLRLRNPTQVHPDMRETTCSLEFAAQYEDLSSWESDDICPKIKELAFDIESYSFNDLFPDPNLIENCVFQIAVTLKDYADSNIRRILLHLRTPESMRGAESGRCRSIEGIQVENFDTEQELLLRFAQLVVEEDPDILYGYNSDRFDWNYVMVRAQITGCADRFSRLSRMKNHVCTIEEQAFQSAAYGDNKYLRVNIPGRLNVDLMIWVQRNMPADRYPSLALDVVAETEIGQNKHDVDYKAIFAAYRTGNEEKCTEVGDYCCQDAVLVQRLCIKLDVVTQMFEMSNITHTPPMYLLQKGQEVKAFSQISKKAMQKGFLVPLAEERSQGSFTGAIVLTPKIGQYTTPVAILDFASLYPSIQVAYQVCYSTIVLKQCSNCKIGKTPCQRSRYQECMDNLPGVEYSTIEWDDDTLVYREKSAAMRPKYFKNVDEAKVLAPRKEILANIERNDPNDDVTWREEKKHFRYRFAQKEASVIPDLQVELKKNRKAVRRMMGPIEHSTDPDDQLRYRVLNGRQLAIKVSMNSLYGFTSAFKLNLMELSAAVTAKGREMIEQTRAFMETRFEEMAMQNLWSLNDTQIYYDKSGREVVAEAGKDGWIRKFPTAIAGKPWTDKPLAIGVVAGDTDSVFCNFPLSTLPEVISLCHKAEVILTDEVFNRAPIEMEYEKTYYPLIIDAKKKYIGLKYEMDDKRWKVDFKGIAIKRRNYCAFVKEVFWSVIYPALGIEPIAGQSNKYQKVTWDLQEGPKRAIQALRESLNKLECNQVAIDDLVISASLKSHYKNENLPHIQLAKRMKERDAGSAPQSGQRFGYIVVYEASRGNELCAKTEDPRYAKVNNLEPDYLYYLDNQVRKPLVKFLNLIGQATEAEQVFSTVQDTLFGKRKRQRSVLESTTRSAFCTSSGENRPTFSAIAPLKAPKKKFTSKKQKLAQIVDGCASMKGFTTQIKK